MINYIKKTTFAGLSKNKFQPYLPSGLKNKAEIKDVPTE